MHLRKGDLVKKKESYYLVESCEYNRIYSYKIECGKPILDNQYLHSKTELEKIEVCKTRIDAFNLKSIERGRTLIVLGYMSHEKMWVAFKNGVRVFKLSNVDGNAIYVKIGSMERTVKGDYNRKFRLVLQDIMKI